MKKLFSTLISIVLLIAAVSTGCTVKEPVPVKEFFPLTAQGGEDGRDEVFGRIEELSLDAKKIDVGEFPVFINNYPSGHGGPEYVIDDALKAYMEDNLRLFMDLLNGEKGEYNLTWYDDTPYKVFFEEDGFEARSWATGITLNTSKYNIVANIADGTILENPIITAAAEYLGITANKVTETVSYKIDGSVSEYIYKITEESGDYVADIINGSFKYIKVIYSPEASDIFSIFILIYKAKDVEEYGTFDNVAYEAAADYVKDTFSVGTGSLISEITYRTDIKTGYFIPCYTFYIEQGTAHAGVPEYSVAYVPLIWLDAE